MGIKMLTYYSPLLKKFNFYAQNASILAKDILFSQKTKLILNCFLFLQMIWIY